MTRDEAISGLSTLICDVSDHLGLGWSRNEALAAIAALTAPTVPPARDGVVEHRKQRGIMHGLRAHLMYDPDANGNTNRPDRLSDAAQEEIADFLAARGLFGAWEITTLDDDAMHKEPCVHCVTAKAAPTPREIEVARGVYIHGSTRVYDGPERQRMLVDVFGSYSTALINLDGTRVAVILREIPEAKS